MVGARADNSASHQAPARKKRSLIIGVAFSCIFLYLAFRKLDLDAVVDTLRGASLLWLCLSQVPKVLGFLCMATRTKIMLHDVGTISRSDALSSVLVAFAGNNLLPLRMGELLRIETLARKSQLQFTACLSAIAMERLLDVFVLFFLFVVLLASNLAGIETTNSLYVIAGGLLTIVVCLYGIVRQPKRVSTMVERIAEGSGRFGLRVLAKVRSVIETLQTITNKKTIQAAAVVTVLYWCTGLLSIQCWIFALNFDLPWYTAPTVIAFISFAATLPSSPAFVGTYHYFAALALSVYGVSWHEATSFAVMGHFMSTVPATAVALWWLSRESVALVSSYQDARVTQAQEVS